ncbi:hypothetical protein DICVIV_05299 [Dictyocaulus viviparus]|uniref:Uncharacterized protein n=1 Tax=Dictyocaulus viviparus TaxID=29172 RepID=A0A0D8XXQ5_DICVI|nr:hypothetical protein DICVIV_05299 [Dictyocaulus viviparus]
MYFFPQYCLLIAKFLPWNVMRKNSYFRVMSKRRHCDDHDDNVDGEVIPSDPEERLSEAVLSRHILRKDDSSRNRKSKKFGETDAKRTSGKGDVSSDSSSSSSSDSDMSSSNCASSRSGSPVATKKREKGSKNKSSAAAAERRRFPKSIEDQEEENKTSSTSVGERHAIFEFIEKDGQCKNRNSSGQEDCKARSEHSKPKEKESYIDAKKLEGLEHHHDSSSESVGETQKLDSKKGKKKKHSKRKRSKSGMKKKRRSRSCTASG